MESRVCLFLLRIVPVLVLLGITSGCSLLRTDEPEIYSESEPVIEPGIERRTITEADIDSEDFEVGAFVGVMSIEDFGSNVVYGVRAAYHTTEDFFFEVGAGTTQAGKTSYETLSGGAQLLTGSQRDLNYYNISLGYNVLPGEGFIGSRYAFNSALYVMAGAGDTEFADDSHFTFNVGMGYRFLMNDWVALHLDFKDHIFESDLLGTDKYTHNLEGTVGLTMFF